MGPFTSTSTNKSTAFISAGESALSVEEIRRITRQRLIGALLLTVLGVVVFSVLLDTKPRPVVEVPIEVVRPLPPEAMEGIDSAPPQVQIRTLPATTENNSERSATRSAGASTSNSTSPMTNPISPPIAKQSGAQGAQGAAASSQAGASAAPINPNARVVLHIGSYQTDKEVQEARNKAAKAGLTTYIQVVDTSKGKFTRVRIGPFDNTAAAQKVLPKAKAAGLAGTEIRAL